MPGRPAATTTARSAKPSRMPNRTGRKGLDRTAAIPPCAVRRAEQGGSEKSRNSAVKVVGNHNQNSGTGHHRGGSPGRSPAAPSELDRKDLATTAASPRRVAKAKEHRSQEVKHCAAKHARTAAPRRRLGSVGGPPRPIRSFAASAMGVGCLGGAALRRRASGSPTSGP